MPQVLDSHRAGLGRVAMRVNRLPIGCALRLTKRLSTYDHVVEDYIGRFRDGARFEAHWFGRSQRTLRAAIQVGAMAQLPSGKRHPHQHRIPKKALCDFANELTRVAARLRRSKSFEQLHEIVVAEANELHRIGELTAYDTAQRIGAFLKLEPRRVYLHAGTRQGARVLGLGDREWIEPTDVPASFRRLRPSEIEDVLCMYRDDLAAIRRKEVAHSKSRV